MGVDLFYLRPKKLDDALEFLRDHGKEAAIVAGGTDVMVNLRSGELKPKYLMDVSRLPELKGIEIKDGGLRVGAGVTISDIFTAPILTRLAPALQKASYKFASKQVRNVATIGGNVAHCSPCGDMVPPLIIHEAKVVLKSSNGERTIPIQDVPTEPYRSSIDPEEIVVCFILKPKENVFSDFQKIGRRKELAISRASMAVMAESDVEGKITFMRLALGSCTPTPQRSTDVEYFLTGKVPSEALLWEAGQMVANKMIAISGVRSSTVYKEKAVQGLFMRILFPLVKHA